MVGIIGIGVKFSLLDGSGTRPYKKALSIEWTISIRNEERVVVVVVVVVVVGTGQMFVTHPAITDHHPRTNSTRIAAM
jgi:hypothetical protein